jgi:hypothetical protein
MANVLYKANQTIIETVAWTANRSSGAVPMTQYENTGLQIVWSSLTGTLDGSITIAVSNDGANWDAVGTTTTISSASGTKCIAIENIFFTYIKVDAVKNNITGGNIAVFATFK